MATPVGNSTLTSLSRRYIIPEIPDQIYGSNAITYRLNQSRRRQIPGGYQIEVPLLYRKHTIGGSFAAYQQLDVSAQDNILSAAWDWKYHYNAVTIDHGTLIKKNSPEAVFDLLQTKFEQANMDTADKIGTGLQSDATANANEIDGLKGAVDDGGVAATYAGLLRATYTWWVANDDSTTATLTAAALRSMYFNCKEGGRVPTVIYSRTDQLSRYLALGEAAQEFPVGASGHDPQLYSAGFTGAYWMNVPWIEDSHTFDGPNASNSSVVFLNEFYIDLGVNSPNEFVVSDFQRPHDQLVWSSIISWAGNLIVKNCATQGKLTNLSA